MQLKKLLIIRGKYIFTVIAVLAMLFSLIFVPQVTSKGVKDGLNLCGQVVIPSLFPFMVLSTFLIKSGLCSLLGRIFAPLTKKIFRLPGTACGAIIMGLIGGFPVGSRMTAQLYRDGEISRSAAQRMLMFCVNAGPAFVIGAIGSMMLGSRKAGFIMFISLSLSSLFIGFISRFIACDGEDKSLPHVFGPMNIQKSLVESVADGAGAMLSVCAWIILFCCACSLLSLLPEGLEVLSVPLKCLFEVTSGSAAAAASGVHIAVITGIVGWSGLCVHCQVLEYVKAVDLRMSVFLTARATSGALASLISFELFRVFPCEVPAFISTDLPASHAFSPYVPACAGILVMGALLILDLDMNRKMC
ncbi:MAG: hypothetical protein GX824_00950 [Clostridiales bacterium]|nr:hypothetical protein [Clostridiales bacterium]